MEDRQRGNYGNRKIGWKTIIQMRGDDGLE